MAFQTEALKISTKLQQQKENIMNKFLQKALTAGLVLGFTFSAMATIELPRLIGNDMVLQQNIKNTLWGWVKPGATVTVKASWGATATAKADADGKWKALIATPGHGTGHGLTITCGKDTIKITNVAIGEVWLCVGQSNMGWAAGGTFSAAEETTGLDLPNFRMFRAVRERSDIPVERAQDIVGKWHPLNEEYAKITSAVSFYFAKRLHLDLDVPVGIIIKAYAGTPIEAWIPKVLQLDDPRTLKLIDADAALSAKMFSPEDLEKERTKYNKALEEYKAKVAKGITTRKPSTLKDLEPPAMNKPKTFGTQHPGVLYNAMIHPMRHYGIRGLLWYQGERNSKSVPQAANYRRQLNLLINSYRSIWNRETEGQVAEDFPFLLTQLPSWHPAQVEPDEGLQAPWAVNREMMRLATYDLPNVAVSVAIDTGDAFGLHPKNKKPIGTRHAYLAEKMVYGKDLVAYGPRYTKHMIQRGKLLLNFDSIGSGLMAARPGDLDSFTVAGKDREWHWATGKIVGDTVVVSSSKVRKPVAVRYAWAMNPSQRNLLYNKEGIPASPFRTDDWPLFDPNDEVINIDKKKPKAPEGYQAKDWDRPAMTQ